jgi:bifunctional non-homologous end joining protein LigD
VSLTTYRKKRDFTRTAEPVAGRTGDASSARGSSPGARSFVIQKHDASRLHYDLRLELGGTLKSWAVPKGMPFKKGEKRLAVQVEDHPVSYRDFEGTIPAGEYGGGTVMVWDTGTYEPLGRAPLKELAGGKLHFHLHGSRLQGEWYLVRLKDADNQWLVIRGGDDFPPLSKKAAASSVLTGRTMAAIAKGGPGSKTSVRKNKAATKAGRKAAKKATPASKNGGRQKPAFVEPMKTRLVTTAPPGEWSYEIKFDGFRALAIIEGASVSLISRTKNDMTAKFPELVESLQSLKLGRAVIDGEIVALDSQGRTSFQLLQARENGTETPPLLYYAFDLLHHNGHDLRDDPLEKRRDLLEKCLDSPAGLVRFSGTLGTDAGRLMKEATRLGLEGLIGKRPGSPYEAGKRSGAWVKLKLHHAQELVIGGATPPAGTRKHFGALLVGYYDGGKLCYAGKVGTGFNQKLLAGLDARLARIQRATCPFAGLPEDRTGRYGQGITASVMKQCRWVTPSLVAQVKFTEWTRDGRLRQPVFVGLREDKPAREVVREGRALP